IYSQNAWNPDSGEWEKVLGYFFHYKSVVTGKPEIIANDIQVYPNPTQGQITISGLLQPAELKLYSIQGKLLKTDNQVVNTLDISDLPAGVYILNLFTGNESVVRRIVINK
ncbi:MAG: T9SS type A sorting domain-containing protein, partial [Bacteroidia bacterium]|nr:T9SS type A sorting domain-containing protein [Bacteroidia bacterium]